MASIGFVSLGCSKALVDSENIITVLRKDGYDIVDNYTNADLVIINTCGFIESAIDESLATIGEALQVNDKVIVTGCLGAKTSIITNKYPQILGITGPHATAEVMNLVYQFLPKPHNPFIDIVPKSGIKLTPKHYAYLKISEGCNNTCTFCIIPSMRGKLQSYPIDTILQQAQLLVNSGVKELLVISQDTGAYGSDIKYRHGFYNGKMLKSNIFNLCNELGKLNVWVRLHYVYPYPHIDEIIPLMANGLVIPYLDVPFQHASPKILKLMKRPGNIEKTIAHIKHWRAICPAITIRSTFIVGFPGETAEDFEMLLDFLRQTKLDRVGCFKYSHVVGASANDLPNHVSEQVKQKRYELLMQTQMDISRQLLKQKIGKTIDVIIDNITADTIVSRSKSDSPEIDGLVYIKSKQQNTNLKTGDVIKVKITDSNEYDLFAQIV
jgi:ribosomal protein S12 methylthiotransferase